ncbi:unnamed protein product [Diatraea saccharalis]|uniref:U4/U6.U5 tri-snRNP-associated protein 1 n=1 Tax=Diatraea saccharalis TaxID=40085 RepID=A0A9P0C5Q5_9NEOP|nr:unnamed protein product [Diatraea saccharalis]
MGSKKHKKESKKRKHRSRSRSPLDGEERERKRHKKHKDRKKDRSPDVEEVPVDSHLRDNGARVRSRSSSASADRERERERDRRNREVHRPPRDDRDKSLEVERAASPVGASGGGGASESLSIEETNKLRAKLGLKPLEVTEKPADDGKIKDDLGEFYHKPASNITQQKKTEKLREKLEERKEKRKLEQKLKTTLLAEGSDDEDASAWVKKSRELDKQKQEAAKRAAMLDELDAEFGVGALVEQEQQERQQRAYSGASLAGLRVAHQLDQVAEEREVVLTLADQHVLADQPEDVLVNVNMLDDERYRKNIEERKKAKVGYQAYEDEEDVAAAALGISKPVLGKYDDELLREQRDRARGFVIGLHQDKATEPQRTLEVARRLQSLQAPAPRLASDYLDHHEIHAKFKKTKRKGKMRKKPKAEPIDVEEYEAGTVPLHTDDTEVVAGSTADSTALDSDEAEPDRDLQAALARARALALRPAHAPTLPKVEEVLQHVKEEEAVPEGGMLLDATAEFCRTLAEPALARHSLAEVESEEMEAEAEAEAGAWSRVDTRADRTPDLHAGPVSGLEAEPALGAGVAGALRLALSKGYLERAPNLPPPRPHHHHLLHAAHYSIEDKAAPYVVHDTMTPYVCVCVYL